MELTLEDYARRCVGVIRRVYSGDRYGVIIAATGERLLFRRAGVIGDGETWLPEVGQVVAFARVLDRRGLKAFKVRPLPLVIGSHSLAQAAACFGVEAAGVSTGG